MPFRSVLFWMHLAAGVVAGIAIAIMSFTGAVLAFEDEIVAWFDRGVSTIVPPEEDTRRLDVDEMRQRLLAVHPEATVSAITVRRASDAAVLFTTGRDEGFYLNPYDGTVREIGARKLRAFMRMMLGWHRSLGREGEQREIGRAITGAGNLLFLFLACSGLYIWFPRRWCWRAFRPSLWFNYGARGRARDWNWHNVLGFWTAPILIVLTLSGVVMSYRWANSLVYTLTGSEAPAGRRSEEIEGLRPYEPPAPDARPLPLADLFDQAANTVLDWTELSMRLGGRPRAGSGTRTSTPRSASPGPVSVTARTGNSWPRFASTRLTLDPYTGELLQRAGYRDQSSGRRLRTWLRFLHTGEALGWPGKLAAGLASLSALVLVYTGFALSWRRFFSRTQRPTPDREHQPTEAS